MMKTTCRNNLCRRYGKHFRNEYTFCPFCGKLLKKIIQEKMDEIYKTPKKETIDLRSMPRFEDKTPDTDRMI